MTGDPPLTGPAIERAEARGYTAPVEPFALLARLRAEGWWVARHYDDPDRGRTRWMLLHPNHPQAILCGAGATDLEALSECARAAGLE